MVEMKYYRTNGADVVVVNDNGDYAIIEEDALPRLVQNADFDVADDNCNPYGYDKAAKKALEDIEDWSSWWVDYNEEKLKDFLAWLNNEPSTELLATRIIVEE